MRQSLRPAGTGSTRSLVLPLAANRGSYRVDTVLPTPAQVHASRHCIRILWTAPVEAGDVEIALTVWGQPARVEPPAPKGASPSEATPPPPATTATLFAWRRARSADSPVLARARAFFNDLDEQTFEFARDRADLQVLLEWLHGARLTGTLDPLEGFDPSPELAAMIEATCETFVRLFERHFTSAAEIEEAFDLFARGELSLLDDASLAAGRALGLTQAVMDQALQPNSMLQYLFAELAALCRHLRVACGSGPLRSPGVWEQVLPALVYAQRRFHAAYARPGERFARNHDLRGIPPPGLVLRSLTALRDERRRGIAEILSIGVEKAWSADLRKQVRL